MAWWHLAHHASPKPLGKALDCSVLLMDWIIWKQHNECTLENGHPFCSTIPSKLKEEAKLWARVGALGLRVLLHIS